jgi:hypothetical protein
MNRKLLLSILIMCLTGCGMRSDYELCESLHSEESCEDAGCTMVVQARVGKIDRSGQMCTLEPKTLCFKPLRMNVPPQSNAITLLLREDNDYESSSRLYEAMELNSNLGTIRGWESCHDSAIESCSDCPY